MVCYADRRTSALYLAHRYIWLSGIYRDIWLTNSGASAHITFRKDWFVELRETQGDTVSLGDDGVCAVEGVDKIEVGKLVNGSWKSGTIENVLYVPSVMKNLFSVGVCPEKGFSVKFEGSNVTVECYDQIAATGVKQSNRIFRMFFRVPHSRNKVNVSVTSVKLWHERLGHINKRSICELAKKGLVKGVIVKDTSEFFCEACHLGKQHKLPFNKSVVKVSRKPGEFVHSDVCGPMQVRSFGGAEYFVTFKDEATAFCHVYFLNGRVRPFY